MISTFASFLLGKLSLNQLPNNPITAGGAIILVLIPLAAVIFISVTRRWKWLYREWLTTQDPKKIGKMYIIVAVLMGLRGLSDVILIRLQQALSVGHAHGIISASMFQQVVSAHGTIMIFFVAMGLMFGVINMIVPLQIGARDVAFPFLNATSFWLFVAGMVLINVSLVIGDFAATGWLAYPPLSELKYSPTVGVDYWIWSLEIAGVGSLLAGVNFIVTILKKRVKGMKMMLMPLFSWSVLGSMFLVVFAFPILTVTLTLLAFDRTFGMHFFTAGHGGNMMMYVNLIWAWGHPEVYILVLPAFGVYSEVVATYARKKLFGYTSMVWAIWAIVILSFIVWLHHFFTMGAGSDVNAFFGIMTMIIAVPTGVKLFNWLFTLYRGKINMKTPVLWFIAFVVVFTIGGMAGVIMAVPPLDFQLHNSLFLIAHFHMMIVSGVLFGYFAAITYWFPKFFGFKLNERLGRYAFWSWLIGFLLAFVPLYILGFMGATRRLDHYSASLGWQPLFIAAGVGVVFIICGVVLQFMQLGVSIWQRNSNRAGRDPWDGRTLEWSLPTPPPSFNFARLPIVTKRDSFWYDKQAQFTDSRPYEPITIPKNSPLSMVIACGAFFLGFAFVWHIWWLAVVGLLVVIVTIIWRSMDEHTEYELDADEVMRIDRALTPKEAGL
jgi:cytochrome o ubiquinol oxidase subunit 1